MICANENNANAITSSVRSTTSMSNNVIKEEQFSMTRKLRRMKRKLLLEHVSAAAPAHIQLLMQLEYSYSRDSSSSSSDGSICSSSPDF